MAKVTLLLPKILNDSVGTVHLELKSATLRGALDEACRKIPALRVHLFDLSGKTRAHILCLHNGKNISGLKSPDIPLRDGDEITIIQAISGG